MAKSPELVIPLRMEMDKAFNALKKLTEEGKEAGKQTKEGLDEANSAGLAFADTLENLITHQGYSIARDAAAAMAQGYKESAEYIREIAKEYTGLRTLMQEIAALQGKDNTGSFTSDQAKAASSAGLTPEEWLGFQSSFQAAAGAFLEGDEARMNEADAEEYQKRLAAFAKARGVDAGQVARLGGSILQFSEGDVTVDDAMAQFGRAFKTMEIAPGDLNALLGDTNRVMAQGASSDEAAQLLHLGTLFDPGAEQTAVRRVLGGLGRNIMEGTGEDLGGIDNTMSPLQKIETAARALAAREDAGEDLDEVLVEYFPERLERESMKGFINRGVRDRGFERVRGFNEETPDDFAAVETEKYRQTDAGRFATAQAELAAERIVQGEKFKEVEQAKLEAEKQLTEEGRFEDMTGLGDVGRSLWSNVPLIGSGTDVRTQLIQERATANAFKKAQEGGSFTFESGDAPLGQAGQTGWGLNETEFNKNMLKILESIEKNTAKEARPLAARPPDPKVR